MGVFLSTISLRLAQKYIRDQYRKAGKRPNNAMKVMKDKPSTAAAICLIRVIAAQRRKSAVDEPGARTS